MKRLNNKKGVDAGDKKADKSSLSNIGYSGDSGVGELKCVSFLRPLHRYFLPLVTEGRYCWLIMRWQQLCGIRDGARDGSLYNLVLHGYFCLASMLGEELYYCVPVLVWLGYPMALTFTMYMGLIPPLGQLVKDVLHLPRPPTKFRYEEAAAGKQVEGVIAKLETHFGTEYGLPSTHAMSATLVFPVMYALLQFDSCAGTTEAGVGAGGASVFGLPLSWFLLGVFVTASCCLSRLYMGVHSLADLASGLFLAVVLQALLIGGGLEARILSLTYTSAYGPLVPLLSILAFIKWYPATTPWSASYATASELLGLWAGLCVSYWASLVLFPTVGASLHAQSLLVDTCTLATPALTLGLTRRVLRLIVGLILTFGTRLVSKVLATKFMLWLLRLGITTVPEGQSVDGEGRAVPLEHAYVVETPRRIIGLLLTTGACVLVTPVAWEFLGI